MRLKKNQFEFFYQAKVGLEERMVIGAEALLLWDSPTLSFVSPAELIPVAEQSGLIISIDN